MINLILTNENHHHALQSAVGDFKLT